MFSAVRSLLFSLLATLPATAQTTPGERIPFINSAEAIQQGIEAHDAGRYRDAAELYRSVPEGDTSYALARSELALSLLYDSLYADARDAAQLVLSLPPHGYERNTLLHLGHTYDLWGKTDSAHLVYDSLIRKNPFDHQPCYEKGAAYFRAEDYDRALVFLHRAAMLNPYHFRTHYLTGATLAAQGRLSEAYLAFATSLLLTTDASAATPSIRGMAGIARGDAAAAEAYSAKAERYHQPLFDEIDEIIHARLPLQKAYNFSSELAGDPVVNVLHAIMEKISSADASQGADTSSFTLQYYVPLYRKVFEEKLFEPFTLLAFSGFGIERVDRLAKRTKRGVEEARNVVFPYLDKIASTQVLPHNTRNSAQERYFLDAGNEVFVVGRVASRKPLRMGQGLTQLYQSGALVAEGNYDPEGRKMGLWRYYNAAGVLIETEEMRAGENHGTETFYWADGSLKEVSHYNNGEIADSRSYGRGGVLEYHVQPMEGGRSKKVTQYHPGGAVRNVLRMDAEGENPLDGPFVVYTNRGLPERELTMRDGKLNGPYKAYYADGALRESGAYKNGEYHGRVRTFYSDGTTLEQDIQAYDEGKVDGVWEEFDVRGRLHTRTGYRNGKKDGVETFYHPSDSGRAFGTITYRAGMPVGYRYTDPTGRVVGQRLPDADGDDFTLRTFYASGARRTEAAYHSGKLNGEVRSYAPGGALSTVTRYVDDEEEGISTRYYSNGKKSSESTYAGGVEDGYTRSWNAAGLLQREGWMKNGVQAGLWRIYNDAGTLDQEVFYYGEEEVRNGPERNYLPNVGIPDFDNLYEHGLLSGLRTYDTSGRLVHSARFPGGNGRYRRTASARPDGPAEFECDLKAGLFSGPYTRRLPGGTVTERGYFRLGRHDSTYEAFYPSGLLRAIGNYRDGEAVGQWRYYDPAGLLSREFEYADDGKKHGEDRLYMGGVLRYRFRYVHDSREGEAVLYGEDTTKVAAILFYEDDELVGYTSISRNGVRLPVTKVVGGTATVQTLYPNGQKATELSYKGSLLEGLQRYYYSNGTLAEEESYTDAVLKGTTQVFYPSGKTAYTLTYEAGEPLGRSLHYAPDGATLVEDVTYERGGYRHGTAFFRHPQTGATNTVRYFHGRAVDERKGK